jgi:hypothetical protein
VWKERVAPDIADAPLRAGIAPAPAEAVVEHRESFSRLQQPDHGGVVRWGAPQRRWSADDAIERNREMGGNDPAGERDVGEVPAVGVEVGVRRVGGSGKGELLSAGGRRRAPGR